jgi:anti-sigma factor RsiW
MRHDEALDLLPLYSAGELATAGELEVHLAGCASCSAELARYRELSYSMRSMRSSLAEPSPALRMRLVAAIPPRRVRDDLRRIAREHRALSIGTAAIGITAVGLLWWRSSRRRAGGAPVPAAG